MHIFATIAPLGKYARQKRAYFRILPPYEGDIVLKPSRFEVTKSQKAGVLSETTQADFRGFRPFF